MLQIKVGADIKEAIQALKQFSTEIDKAGGVTQATAVKMSASLNKALDTIKNVSSAKIGDLDFTKQFEDATNRINASIDKMANEALGITPNVDVAPSIKSIQQLESEMDGLREKIAASTDVGEIQKLSVQFGVLQGEANNLKGVFNSIKDLKINTSVGAVIPDNLIDRVQSFGGGVKNLTPVLNQLKVASAQSFGQVATQLEHVGNRSSTARFAVQNLGNVIRDIPFGINNPAIFSTALDHVVSSMTMLKQEAAQMSAATGQSITGFGLLKQSLAGGGGLLLAFNAVSLAATLLIPLFFNTGDAAKSQADKIKQARQSLDDYVEGLNDLDKSKVKGLQNSQEELIKLKTLYDATQNTNIAIGKRKKLVDELQEQYPKYFANISDEIILAGGAKKAYDQLSSAILASAKARAAQDTLVDIQKQLLAVDQELAGNAVNKIKLQQQLNTLKAKPVVETSATGEERLTAVGAQVNRLQQQLNGFVSDGNGLLKQRNDLLSRSKVLSENISKQVEVNPDALLKPTGTVKKGEKPKFDFLFDFLPFDPNGKLKPEQRGQLLDAIDKFSKDFSGILKGVQFSGDANQRIQQAKTFDLKLKAGRVEFDLTRIKEATDKLKPEDLLPNGIDFSQSLKKDEEGAKEAIDQFINGVQNESERLKNLKLFGDLPDFSKDLNAQFDLFKNNLKRIGAKIPETIQATDIFGNPVEITFDQLFDTSKIANSDALEALRKAFDKIKGKIFDLKTGLQNAINDALKSISVEGFSSIGEAIGAALSGGDIGSVFQRFEATLGSAIQALGKQIIGLFITADVLQKALKSIFTNPVVGIAAGIALVAVGAALKNLASGGVKGFAKGGWVGGTGTGDTVPAMLTPGEYVVTRKDAPIVAAFLKMIRGGISSISNFKLPLHFATGGLVPNIRNTEVASPLGNIQKTLSGTALRVTAGGQLTTRISGRDLLFVLDQAGLSNKRNFGR